MLWWSGSRDLPIIIFLVIMGVLAGVLWYWLFDRLTRSDGDQRATKIRRTVLTVALAAVAFSCGHNIDRGGMTLFLSIIGVAGLLFGLLFDLWKSDARGPKGEGADFGRD
jgi:predicted permease